MNGVKLPETIKELTKGKDATLFVDGDRGGKLIIKNVTENADINYIAIAPEGREVEELTSKEILQALRKKITVKDYFESEAKSKGKYGKLRRKDVEEDVGGKDIEVKELKKEEKETIKKHLDELIGTRAALLFNKNMDLIKKMPISRLMYFKPEEEVYVLAVNDTAYPSIIRVAEEINAKHLIANNFTTTDTKVNLVSL